MKTKTNYGHGIFGIVFASISMIYLPNIFGSFAIIFGLSAISKNDVLIGCTAVYMGALSMGLVLL